MSKLRVDEDDDLDDLDDIVDQFSSSAPLTSPPPAGTSASASTSAEGDDDLSEAFAAQLAEEMASIFKDLGAEQGASTPPGGPDMTAERERFNAVWEANQEMSGPSTKDSTSEDFSSRIRSTMDKRRATESDLKSSGSTAGGDFESLLSQLQELGDEGAGDEEHLGEILESMMGQLMSKDVLYEPLKELHDKLPEYLKTHSSTIPPEDKERFNAQISCINRLLVEFEAKSYRDDDEKSRAKIVQLMNELQTHGSPPEEVMGPLPPGFSMGADGLPDPPEDCKVN